MFNFDNLSQSATANIAGLYQPPEPPKPPELPGLPGVQYAAPATPPPVSGPSGPATLIPTLQRGHGLIARINRHLTGDPADYNELTKVLTPQQIEDARPGFFETLFGDPGMTPEEAYNARINALLNRHKAVEEAAQTQAIQARRDAVLKQFPPPQSGDEEAMRVWANKVYPLFDTGDTEANRKYGPLVDRFAADKNAVKTAAAGAYFKNIKTGETRSFSRLPDTSIGPDWVQLTPPGSANGETTLWRDTTNQQYFALPNSQTPLTAQLPGANIGGRYVPEVTAREQDVQGNVRDRAVSATLNSQRDNLVKQRNQFALALSALDQLEHGNSAAYHPAILDFAGSIDPRAQLRQGTIQLVKHIDPSFNGNLRQWFAEKLSGTLPPEQIANMRKVTLDGA